MDERGVERPSTGAVPQGPATAPTWDRAWPRVGGNTWGAPAPTWPRKAAPWEPRPAAWGRRAAGLLIDLVIAGTIPFVLLGAFGATAPQNDNAPLGATATALLLLWFVAMLGALIAYPVWCIARRGQTPGMRAMHIRLYRRTGEMTYSIAGTKEAWFRWGTWIALVFVGFGLGLLLDYAWPLWDGQNRCLHDLGGHTVAVDERERGAG